MKQLETFAVFCLQIYEERVIDLLAIGRSNKDTLSIRETNKGNVFVSFVTVIFKHFLSRYKDCLNVVSAHY